MSSLGSYELTHPELLSKQQLCEILRNSCIGTLNFEKMPRNELLEMYKLIAMPLPQRRYGEAKSLHVEADVTSVKTFTVRDNDMHDLTTGLNKGNKRMFQTSSPQTDTLKSLINDQKSISKKIRLCPTSEIEAAYNGIDKHRCNDQNEESLIRKRQKITWP